MTLSDEFLLAQFKQGDADAFREIVQRYTVPLYNLAHRWLRDPMEAENITQETFLRVVTALDHMRLDIPVKPYLFRIAINLCHDRARHTQPLFLADVSAGNADDETFADDTPSLWDNLAEEEQHAQLRAALDDLPAPYRAVLTLRYGEGFSYTEIAQTLNLPLNTVRTHLRRAKQQLRLRLGLEQQRDHGQPFDAQ